MTRPDPLAPSMPPLLAAANEPTRGRLLPVEIDGLRDAGACHTFWTLVGDLAADLLLEGTEGPWTPGVGSREMITP